MTIARQSAAQLADLFQRERVAMADFLLALAEFDRHRLWLELGYSSLFHFLHRDLGMSKGAAFYRKTAAELVQKFPEVVEPLRDGRLCITTVIELAKVITAENREDVLPRFFHRSKCEAKAVSAALAPEEAPARRQVVTRLRLEEPRPSAVQPVEPLRLVPGESGSVAESRPPVSVSAPWPAPAPAPAPQRDSAEPLTAELRRLHITVSSRFLEKLAAATAALSHTHPGGNAEEILEAGLDLLLERQAKRMGLVKQPREKARPSAPEHVPARVRRAVWKRDGGRCQWPLESGGVCGSTLRVELDHIHPQALGGQSTVGNMRLLCRMHNDLAARRVFGEGWMDRFTQSAGRGSELELPFGAPPAVPRGPLPALPLGT
ncbi:MAG: hypothetical protein A2V77_02785 [Anaeromyxobacter sp. RBG_16_69_14]|nr:MAG: hypothetical protein A2V77_02785 [Anaeromyxobacter sp. RBG_16_69_14]